MEVYLRCGLLREWITSGQRIPERPEKSKTARGGSYIRASPPKAEIGVVPALAWLGAGGSRRPETNARTRATRIASEGLGMPMRARGPKSVRRAAARP
jgi:hypothetical protein